MLLFQAVLQLIGLQPKLTPVREIAAFGSCLLAPDCKIVKRDAADWMCDERRPRHWALKNAERQKRPPDDRRPLLLIE
jgi:hypothetical protein